MGVVEFLKEKPTAERTANEGTVARRIDSNQKLGVNPADNSSRVLQLLGQDRMAAVPAVPAQGRWLVVDRELALRLGFHPEMHGFGGNGLDGMSDVLALRAAKPGETPTTTLYADRYGGIGLGYHHGAARAAFLSRYNVNLKGVGRTPLADQATSFDHNHGGAGLRESILETVFGRLNENLFTHGSTRVLGIFLTDERTQWPDGKSETRALIARTGRQIRPAHLMEGMSGAAPGSLGIFLRASEDSGDLVKAKNGQPDVAATMRNVIARHALTAAEQYRWRILHGATSTSNMELDGGLLDMGTETSQPRTSPIRVIDHVVDHFGTEQLGHAVELQRAYEAMCKSLTPKERARVGATPIDFKAQMTRAYAPAVERELISAAGLPHSLAAALQAKGAVATDFAATAQALAEMHNVAVVNVDKKVVEDAAVVDVYNALRYLPDAFFRSTPPTKSALVRKVMDLLRPLPAGTEQERAAKRQTVQALAVRLVDQYTALMAAAQTESKLSRDVFAHMVTERAAFENAPIDQLYRATLNDKLVSWIDEYERTQDAEAFDRKTRRLIASSLRNVDQLLQQGSQFELADKSTVSEARNVAGIEYGVRNQPNGTATLRLQVSAKPNGDGRFKLALPGDPILTREQINALSYRGSIDAWQRQNEAAASVQATQEGLQISFETPLAPGDVGRAEGTFHCADGDFWLKDGGENFAGYVFAVPAR